LLTKDLVFKMLLNLMFILLFIVSPFIGKLLFWIIYKLNIKD